MDFVLTHLRHERNVEFIFLKFSTYMTPINCINPNLALPYPIIIGIKNVHIESGPPKEAH